jgi:WD40 repeat protein
LLGLQLGIFIASGIYSSKQSTLGNSWKMDEISFVFDSCFAQDGTILEWKFNPITNFFEPAASLSGHSGPVITLLFIGNRLYSGSTDKSIRVCSTHTLNFRVNACV